MVADFLQRQTTEQGCLGGLVDVDDRHAGIAKGQVSRTTMTVMKVGADAAAPRSGIPDLPAPPIQDHQSVTTSQESERTSDVKHIISAADAVDDLIRGIHRSNRDQRR